MKKVIYILLIIFSFPVSGQIKEIGSPKIFNYFKSDYKAGTQNWGISQNENGFMCFANNEGVLIFNGLQWDQIKVSKSKPVRSIFTDSKNTVYIGLLNDFGYLEESESGLYSFKSIRNLLPDGIEDFEDIWKIHEIKEGIVFQTFEYLFILSNNELKVVKPINRFHFSFVANGKLFIDDPGTGIFEYRNNTISKLPWSDEFRDKKIAAILEPTQNILLVCTNENGVYRIENGKVGKWETPVNKVIERDNLFCAKTIVGNYIAFGSILNGLYISDSDGNIVQHINKTNGLQNNTVLSLFSDRDENLWLGLDNGIDYIQVNSPVSYISDYEGIGTGYCSRVFKDKLYLGTNQGLFVKSFYRFSFANEPFELVKNTAGQVWSLNVFDDQLICGHNSGTFRVEDKTATKICNEEGGWKYIRINNHPDMLLGGHFDGLVLLKKESGTWKFYKKLGGFTESCRFLQQSADNSIWVSHGTKGIFRIILDESLESVQYFEHFTSKDGLPSDEENIVFKLNNEVFISTINGIYTFDQASGTFTYSEKLNRIFPVEGRLKTFESDDAGNLWYIAQNESGVLSYNPDGTFTKITSPFKALDGKYVNEFEFIYAFDRENIVIGIDNGFAHYSAKLPKTYSKDFKAFITRVELPYIDSVIHLKKILNTDTEFKFPFTKNSFRFYYTSPFFENSEQLSFSYFLENYSEKWSDFSSVIYKDFINLHEGKYVFRVKAKNIYEIESNTATFSFTILAPWYRSIMAYFAYLIFIFILFYISFRYIRFRARLSKERAVKRHQLESKKREEEYQHQAILNEKEIIRLKNEKLLTEMDYRGKELANQTMIIVQKNKFLSKFKDELNLIQKTTEDPQLRTKMIVLARRLDKEIDDHEQTKMFKTYFEEVHNDFITRLKEKHSGLTPREIHLSAYIRMNLSSKEIASLLNITYRGVEISRYRLRKKLELSREVSLSSYLLNI